MVKIDPREIAVAQASLRKAINATGYGNWVGDSDLHVAATSMITDVENWRATEAAAAAKVASAQAPSPKAAKK